MINPPPPPKIIRETVSIFRTFADAGFILGIPPERLRAWQRHGYRMEELMQLVYGLDEHIIDCQSLVDELRLMMKKYRKKKGYKFPPEKQGVVGNRKPVTD